MTGSPAPDAQETDRRLGDIARMGVVVSREGKRCVVDLGDLETGPIPWFAGRAGRMRVWSPPTVGEQAMVICPDGEVSAGTAILGVFSDSFDAPDDADRHFVEFDDGAVFVYDPDEHTAEATLPEGGELTVTAPGGATLNAEQGCTVNAAQGVTINASSGITFNGDLTVNGTITATGLIKSDYDVVAITISLKTHIHPVAGANTLVPTP